MQWKGESANAHLMARVSKVTYNEISNLRRVVADCLKLWADECIAVIESFANGAEDRLIKYDHQE